MVRHHLDLEIGEWQFVGRFAWSTNRHVDAEIAFRFNDLQSQHEEDKQLKHDVDHRRHLRFDLLAFGRFDLHY